MIIVQIYVDDIIFGAANDILSEDFANCVSSEFEMTMIGGLNFFLGLQIKQTDDRIFINQAKHVSDMLKKFEMEDARPMIIPMSSSYSLTKMSTKLWLIPANIEV